MREHILIACADCKNRWYSTSKNKKNTQEKLQMKKFCKFCHKRTEHKEVK